MKKGNFQLPLPALFSFEECCWFLDRNFDECLHVVTTSKVQKAILVNGQPVLFEIIATVQALEVTVLQGNITDATITAVKNYITDWFDLQSDLAPFYALLKNDKRLAYMGHDFYGLRLIGIPDLFEAICWSIIGQQINLTFAYKLKRRLVEQFGTHMEHNGVIYHLFPGPDALQQATKADLQAMQFTGKKAEYILDMATAFRNGQLSKELLRSLPDLQSRQKALLNMRGIGPWTANYVLMKSLRAPDSIPHGDAGLLNALLAHGVITGKQDMVGINRCFKKFAGWEAYLVLYLWRSLAKKPIPE